MKPHYLNAHIQFIYIHMNACIPMLSLQRKGRRMCDRDKGKPSLDNGWMETLAGPA